MIMKKTAGIFGIVCGGLNAIAFLHMIFTYGFEQHTTYVYSGYYYSEVPYIEPNTNFILVLLGFLALSVCLIVFSALSMRQGRQKGFAITAFVMSCLLLSIIPLVLFWVYLGTSGTKKNKDKEFDRIAFLKKAREEKIISDVEYKKLMLEALENN